MHEELVCLAAQQNPHVGDALVLEEFARQPHVELADISGLLPSRIESCLAQHGLSRRVISKNLNSVVEGFTQQQSATVAGGSLAAQLNTDSAVARGRPGG